jgi:hypothetical protein
MPTLGVILAAALADTASSVSDGTSRLRFWQLGDDRRRD